MTIAPSSSAAVVGGERDRAQLVEVGAGRRARRARPRGLHHVDERLAAGERPRPSCAASRRDRLLDGRRARVLDLTQKHASIDPTPPVTCQDGTALLASPRWRPTTRSSSARGSTRWPAPPCCSRRAGASACSSATTGSAAASTRRPSSRSPGFTHEVLASWHPLFTGSRRLRRAQGRARPTRARVPQHRPPDRDGVPRRLGRVRHDLARGKRRGARAPRRRRRRRLGASFNGFMANADLAFGLLGDRALVGRGSRARRARRTGGSAAAGCWSSPAARSSAAATG